MAGEVGGEGDKFNIPLLLASPKLFFTHVAESEGREGGEGREGAKGSIGRRSKQAKDGGRVLYRGEPQVLISAAESGPSALAPASHPGRCMKANLGEAVCRARLYDQIIFPA